MNEQLPKLLLHLCCGPCAITTIAAAQADGLAAVGLFYNPNIHPLQEYFKRREGAVQVAERAGMPLRFCKLEYDPRVFLRAHAGHARHVRHLRHVVAFVLRERSRRGEREQTREGANEGECALHASTRTSRNMPSSMCSSMWQW